VTEEEARTDLESMLAWDQVPALTTEEVDRLLEKAKVADVYGLAPADTGWTETWDLNRAAAIGWIWKAGKAAHMYSFQEHDRSFTRSDLIKHCQQMATQYKRRVVSTLTVSGPTYLGRVSAN
jgi:hypothetical protein